MTDIAAQVRGLHKEIACRSLTSTIWQDGYMQALEAAANLLTSSPELAEMVRDAKRYRKLQRANLIREIDWGDERTSGWGD
jgi:hypothetical protein